MGGQACEKTKIKMSAGEYYPSNSPVACNGRGVAIYSSYPAKCICSSVSTGKTCQEIRCPGFDLQSYNDGVKAGSANDPECGKGVGVCNTVKGRCSCAATASCGLPDQPLCPNACVYNDCEANCQGVNTDGSSASGLCDRFSGLCSCNYNNVFNGPSCVTPGRGSGKTDKGSQTMIWTATMDKWGWSLCNKGYLLVGMKTDRLQTMDALYNLDKGVCQQPFEASSAILKAVEPSRCYHENWWKKFDTRGGKFCRRNYFVAGLFRSHCNSLYCIEMAKCCSSSAPSGPTASGRTSRTGSRPATAFRSMAPRASSSVSSVVPSTLLPVSLRFASVPRCGTASSTSTRRASTTKQGRCYPVSSM